IFALGIYAMLSFRHLKFEKKVFFFVLILFVFSYYIYIPLVNYLQVTNLEGDQSSIRFLLWNHALEGIIHSPIVGFGPGSFSGLTGPFQGAESHNTFIDLLSNVGLIGLLIFVVLLYKIMVRLYELKEIFLILTMVAVIVFSIFHNVLRHPTYWIV